MVTFRLLPRLHGCQLHEDLSGSPLKPVRCSVRGVNALHKGGRDGELVLQRAASDRDDATLQTCCRIIRAAMVTGLRGSFGLWRASLTPLFCQEAAGKQEVATRSRLSELLRVWSAENLQISPLQLLLPFEGEKYDRGV